MESREVWMDVKGYEGKYQISNRGRVWNTFKQQYMRGRIDAYGYRVVTFFAKNGKRKDEKVHRLVALNFIGNPPEGKTQVNHKDEDKLNNHVENLEWCDAKYNTNYGTRNARISTPIYCVELDRIFVGSREAERELGLDHSSIIKCCKGKRETIGGYHWRYVDVS